MWELWKYQCTFFHFKLYNLFNKDIYYFTAILCRNVSNTFSQQLFI